MPKNKGYTLIPKPVPTRQRASFYKQIIDEFIAGVEKSVLVEDTERKPVTLVQGLRKALEAENTEGIRVVQRGGDTYLTRD
jgi:uncharacterized protein YaaR (DUF327 family)